MVVALLFMELGDILEKVQLLSLGISDVAVVSLLSSPFYDNADFVASGAYVAAGVSLSTFICSSYVLKKINTGNNCFEKYGASA